MQRSEVEMEIVDDEEGKLMKTENTKSRTKKKSTLTKLKEKKQRELGSALSLQSESKNDLNKKEEVKNSPPDKEPTGSQPEVYHFSTKDPPEVVAAPRKDSRPKPKPRGRRSSEVSTENSNQGNDKIENTGDPSGWNRQDSGSSDGATLQMFKNLKMAGDLPDSIDSAISQSSFVPKPPSTPRTPRSNPRTPRGFVLAGKGEKRIREPGSSGDEVEEKKEKSNVITDGFTSAVNDNIKTSSNGPQNFTETAYGAITNSGDKSSRRIPGQAIHGDRLLKRRSSRDSDVNFKSQEDKYRSRDPDPGKPPINRSLTNISANSNNNGNASSITSIAKADDLTISQSPRDKYLKSANRSRSKSPSSHQNQKLPSSKSDLNSSPDKISVSSSPVHAASQLGSDSATDMKDQTVDALQMHYERVLLADAENGNKSTQVLFTCDSPLTLHSFSSPPNSARLDPISPKSHPPPLPEEFSSQSLRTTYKIDPNVRPSTGSGRTGTAMGKSDSGTHSNGDRTSQKSFTSGSILPVITTKEARSRSLLEGSIGSGSPAMLGMEELERYFPERKVNILVGTWNMNELKDITTSLDDFILPEKCDYVQDIYAIGTQENAMNKKEWEIKLQETLGPSHVMYHSVSHGSLHLVIYIRRDLIWFCSTPEDDVVSLRAVTMIKTKGAIGISFTLFGTSYLFINCHLTSDRDNENSRKKYRLGDYFKVIQEMRLPRNTQDSSAPKKPADVTAIFDCVFWFGDLNFRIERKRQAVEGRVNQITAEEIPNFETLLGGDQLLKYMTEGKIFGGFQEGRINFHPTFKFDVNEDQYDTTSKARVPSYTDRIMFRCKSKNEISCMHYDAAMTIKISDHRPVFGQFVTVVRPGRDNTIYAAGHFDRYVYMEANKRRAEKPPVKKKQSMVCSVQ